MPNALATLKFVTAAETSNRNAVSPTERRRVALIARIDEQIVLATAQLENKKPEFSRTVKSRETGQKETKPKTVRAWYWEHNGKFLLTIRYGLTVLQFAKGTNAIEAPNLKGVVAVLNTVK